MVAVAALVWAGAAASALRPCLRPLVGLNRAQRHTMAKAGDLHSWLGDAFSLLAPGTLSGDGPVDLFICVGSIMFLFGLPFGAGAQGLPGWQAAAFVYTLPAGLFLDCLPHACRASLRQKLLRHTCVS